MVTGPGVAGGTAPSIFGFRVDSALPWRFLRAGGGGAPIHIAECADPPPSPRGELVGEWPLHGAAVPARASLYRVPGGYEYWTSDAGRFAVDLSHGRIEVPGAAGDALLREQRLLGMPMILSFMARGDLSLHAAAVEVDGRAVILAGPSRHGKSTLAYAFLRRGHRVLSEDLICCRPETAEVFPGPALIRLRPDMFGGALPPGAFVAAERPDRVFVGFDAEVRGSGAPVPIRGIAFLREGEAMRMERVSPGDALRDLWGLGYREVTVEGVSDSFKKLVRLAASVAVWDVHRPLTVAALESTVELIADQASGSS